MTVYMPGERSPIADLLTKTVFNSNWCLWFAWDTWALSSFYSLEEGINHYITLAYAWGLCHEYPLNAAFICWHSLILEAHKIVDSWYFKWEKWRKETDIKVLVSCLILSFKFVFAFNVSCISKFGTSI